MLSYTDLKQNKAVNWIDHQIIKPMETIAQRWNDGWENILPSYFITYFLTTEYGRFATSRLVAKLPVNLIVTPISRPMSILEDSRQLAARPVDTDSDWKSIVHIPKLKSYTSIWLADSDN